MTYRFWLFSEANARHEDLLERIENERSSLPSFRKDEAAFLALSEDERKELAALETLMEHHQYCWERKKSVA